MRVALRLSGIAATLLHLAHTVEASGRAFTTEKSASTDISADATTQQPPATATSMRQGNSSLNARGRIARLKSDSADITQGTEDADTRESSAAGSVKRVLLLPQLRKALPVLNLPTRAHAAVAAMLARSLHTEHDVLPINLVNLSNKCDLRAPSRVSYLILLLLTIASCTGSSAYSSDVNVVHMRLIAAFVQDAEKSWSMPGYSAVTCHEHWGACIEWPRIHW